MHNFIIEHTKPLFNKHSILSIRGLYILRSLTELFKILKDRQPKSIFSCFRFSRLHHNRLLPPKCVLGISMNNFVFRATSIWNKCIEKLLDHPPLTQVYNKKGEIEFVVIPGSIKNSDLHTCTVPSFKNRLKKRLFAHQKLGDLTEWCDENFEI